MILSYSIRKILRTIVSVGLVLLSVYLTLFLAGFFLRFFLVKKLMPDENVRLLYSNHKKEIERLKTMCLEDRIKSSPTYSHFGISAKTREADCVRLVGSIERCQEYARLLVATNVQVVDWQKECVWLYMDGWGLAGKGVRKGLMWRPTPLPQQGKRSAQQYERIEDGWYIFQINPAQSLFQERTKSE